MNPRNITLAGLYESNIEVIYSTLKVPLHYVFCLDLHMYDNKGIFRYIS